MSRETEGPAKLQVEKQVQCAGDWMGTGDRESWPHQGMVGGH